MTPTEVAGTLNVNDFGSENDTISHEIHVLGQILMGYNGPWVSGVRGHPGVIIDR